MLRTIVAGLVGLLFLVGAVYADTIKGVLVNYDKDAKKITVKVGDDEKTYSVSDNAVVKRGKRETGIEDFKVGEKAKGKLRVVLTVEDDKVTAIQLQGGGDGKKKKKKDDQ